VGFGARGARARSSSPSMSFFEFTANKLDGAATSMEAFKGKPVLILNVASL
jgi:glutathione peroxidase-family protein